MLSLPVRRTGAALLLLAAPLSAAAVLVGSPALATPALATPALAAPAPVQDGTKALVEQGLQLLRQGDDEAALEKFRAALAADPSSEEALTIWREVDQNVWLRMLSKGGEFDLIARAFMDRSKAPRGAARKDAAAIDALVNEALSSDFGARQFALATLAANHGAYTIQGMVGPLGDADNDDRRILAMEAAFRMGAVAVQPVIALLEAPSSALRRSAAVVLGRLGDARALGALAWHAEADTDSTVRAESKIAAGKCGWVAGMGSASQILSHEAAGYLHQLAAYVRPWESNDVAWSFADGQLVDHAISRSVFAAEMARRSASMALVADASNARAVTALAMAYAEASLQARHLAAAGDSAAEAQTLAEKQTAIGQALLLCGSAALESGLGFALESGDARLANVLIEQIAKSTPRGAAVPAAVTLALGSPNRSVRIHAALAASAIDSAFGANPAVVALLADAVGERVQRIAMVIDQDAVRRQSLVSGFEGARWFAAGSDSGASGLARLRRFPGTDLIVVSSSLTDVAVAQVLHELRADARTKDVPVVMVTSAADLENMQSLHGDAVKSVVAAFDAAAMEAALEGAPMNPERERAEQIAAAAATALMNAASLADASRGAALAALADAAAGRNDGVRIPATVALGRFGDAGQQGALAGLLGDAGASAEARSAAAVALSGMATRGIGFTDGAVAALKAALDDSEASVRLGAASALGRWPNVGASERAEWALQRGVPFSVAPVGGSN